MKGASRGAFEACNTTVISPNEIAASARNAAAAPAAPGTVTT